MGFVSSLLQGAAAGFSKSFPRKFIFETDALDSFTGCNY